MIDITNLGNLGNQKFGFSHFGFIKEYSLDRLHFFHSTGDLRSSIVIITIIFLYSTISFLRSFIRSFLCRVILFFSSGGRRREDVRIFWMIMISEEDAFYLFVSVPRVYVHGRLDRRKTHPSFVVCLHSIRLSFVSVSLHAYMFKYMVNGGEKDENNISKMSNDQHVPTILQQRFV